MWVAIGADRARRDRGRWFALDGHAILRGIANIPVAQPFDDNVFGAHNLPFDLAELVGLPHAAAMVLQLLLLVIMLGVAAALARRAQVGALTEAESLHLLAGGILLVSCFVMAQNMSYRGIHFLFVLPALAVCRRGTAWLIVVLMWNSALRPVIDAMTEWSSLAGMLRPGIWLVRELAWWGVITVSAALLLRQVWGVASGRRMEGSICCGSLPSIGINRWRDLGERAQD